MLLRAALACLLLAACAAGGCASTPVARCPAGMARSVEDTLYFGAQRPGGGVVTEAEWTRFAQDTVAPAFPEGFTTWPAQGAWRGNEGVLLREDSRVLVVVHADDAAADAAVQGVADAYQARFEQEAVLRTRTPACLGF